MTSHLFLSRRDWLKAAGLLALAGCSSLPKEEPIWIGHIGPVGNRGESAIQGMQQTLADLREQQVTVGGRSLGVRHVEAGDKLRARAEASRLLAVNQVVCLIVGPGVEGVADVIAIARSHGAQVIVLEGTADRALADQAIWLGIDPETSGEMLARYAIAKGRKVSLHSLRENPIARGFDRAFTQAGGKIGKATSPWPADAVDLAIEEAQGPNGIGRPTLRVGDPPLPVNSASEVWTLTMQPDRANLPVEGRAWVERYEKRYGVRPNEEAILGGEAIALIADGLQRIGSDDRRKLAEDLAGRTEFTGLTGPIVRKDGRTLRPMWVERVANGKTVAAESAP